MGVQGSVTTNEIVPRLNLMFTIAAVSTNVCALPVGTILDLYGPRVSGIIGSILLIMGSFFLAFASHLSFDGYIPGYFFLALGGPFIFISSFQLSNAFPRYSGLILALLTGAFDSSSAIFLFYRLVYTATNESFTTERFFSLYLVVPIFILSAQLLVMPKNSYKTLGELLVKPEEPPTPIRTIVEVSPEEEDDEEDQGLSMNNRRSKGKAPLTHHDSTVSERTTLLGKAGADKAQKDEQRKKDISGVWGALHGYSAWEQIKTPWFILITLFTVIQMTRINYFVATIRPQYTYLLKDYSLAEHVNNVFDVALPVGGVLSIPFIGLVLDNTSTPFVLTILVTWASAIGVLGCLPYLWAAYANIVLFVVYRPLYYTAVSDYAAKVFGFHTFGKVYGLIICLAGILNFIQSALDAMTHKVFHGDPIPVNVILLSSIVVVGVALLSYILTKKNQMQRESLEDEAEGGGEHRMPSMSNGYSSMASGVNGNG